MEKKQYIMIGIAIALVIAVAAPFIASGNPDGLESAFFSIHGAKDFQGDELDEDAAEAAEARAVEITGNDFSLMRRCLTTASMVWINPERCLPSLSARSSY